MGSYGVRVIPGPSHWKTGVSVTPLGREMEQVRVTVSPAMTAGEEGVREMVAGPVREDMSVNHVWSITVVLIVPVGPVVTVLGSVLELATILME